MSGNEAGVRNVNVNSVFQKLQHTNTSTPIQAPALYRCINRRKNTALIRAIYLYTHTYRVCYEYSQTRGVYLRAYTHLCVLQC